MHRSKHSKISKKNKGNWLASKQPKIKGSEFSLTGSRPYANLAGGMNGLSLKLNESSFGIYFQFYSFNSK